jgi:hypothetical protein
MDQLTKEQHGKAREYMVTASMAKTIMHGGLRAWQTLITEIWKGDDGSFAASTGGAREFGHEMEDDGAAKFWDRHPEYEIRTELWFEYASVEYADLIGHIGCSPDRTLWGVGPRPRRQLGLEIKSPTMPETFHKHVLPVNQPIAKHPHFDQCQHSLLVTGLPGWWQVTHCGNDLYREVLITPSKKWRAKYIPKLRHFLAMMNEGQGTKRRMKLSDLSSKR